MHTFIFMIFQTTEPVSNTFTWKDLIVPIVIVIATNIVTYLATRRKSKSEIGQIDANTLKTYLDIIKDIQDNNQSLYEKLQILREKVESVDEMLDNAQDDLEKVQKQLDDCMQSNEQLRTASENSLNNSTS